MRFFISSVRRGLEEERHALPGIISALGHRPVRFEDFSSTGEPSREACLRAVEASDVYLLLLGEFYGELWPDTGRSATEEEFTAARARGIPIRAFRKRGAEPEPRQAEFIARIEDYRSGYFREAFSNPAELLMAVTAAIRELEAAPAQLEWRRLTAALPPVPWRRRERGVWTGSGTTLELHALPLDGRGAIAATTLTGLAVRLTRSAREHGLFGDERAVLSDVREVSPPSDLSYTL